MADAVARAAGVPGEIARRALMLSGDLTRMAEIAMTEGRRGSARVGFEIFRPILPMLASTGAAVAEAVSGFDRSSVEWKLDGIRIQIHRRGEEVRIYTRNLNEITATLPGIVEAVRSLPVAPGRARRRGAVDARREPGRVPGHGVADRQRRPPDGIVTFLFDLLHVDGEDLLDAPLIERAARLASIAPGLVIPGVLTADPDEGKRILEASLSAGHEGVVVKDASSPYAAGRRGGAWRKVKPVRTYDLVVLGAEWGHGRRQGWLSNLHLGARDAASGEFVMVGKTFKGLTDELLRGRRTRCSRSRPSRRGIAVMVRPELVVEIALDGVQSSTRYPGGRRAALRPRQALPTRQGRRRGRHDRRPARAVAGARVMRTMYNARQRVRQRPPAGHKHVGHAYVPEVGPGPGSFGRNT